METVSFDILIKKALETGFQGAEIIEASEIVLSEEFRRACEQNSCGLFGKCWMCPPEIGDIEILIACIKSYSYGLLVQSVSLLEDSFDIEGMLESGRKHSMRMRTLKKNITAELPGEFLVLSSGGCKFCNICSKVTNEPCRSPQNALSSLEAYGISVSETVAKTSLKYINGKDTVTYFGIVLF